MYSLLTIFSPALVFSAALQEGTIGREIKRRLTVILGEFVQIVNRATHCKPKFDALTE